MNLAHDAEPGRFAPRQFAAVLGTTPDELARAIGLDADALEVPDRLASPQNQQRLRELAAVIDTVTPRFGTPDLTYTWANSAPLSGFGEETAMQLLRDGRVHEILDYIAAVNAGVYA